MGHNRVAPWQRLRHDETIHLFGGAVVEGHDLGPICGRSFQRDENLALLLHVH